MTKEQRTELLNRARERLMSSLSLIQDSDSPDNVDFALSDVSEAEQILARIVSYDDGETYLPD